MHTPPVKPSELGPSDDVSTWDVRTWVQQGGLSRNKVSVGEPADGSPPTQQPEGYYPSTKPLVGFRAPKTELYHRTPSIYFLINRSASARPKKAGRMRRLRMKREKVNGFGGADAPSARSCPDAYGAGGAPFRSAIMFIDRAPVTITNQSVATYGDRCDARLRIDQVRIDGPRLRAQARVSGPDPVPSNKRQSALHERKTIVEEAGQETNANPGPTPNVFIPWFDTSDQGISGGSGGCPVRPARRGLVISEQGKR